MYPGTSTPHRTSPQFNSMQLVITAGILFPDGIIFTLVSSVLAWFSISGLFTSSRYTSFIPLDLYFSLSLPPMPFNRLHASTLANLSSLHFFSILSTRLSIVMPVESSSSIITNLVQLLSFSSILLPKYINCLEAWLCSSWNSRTGSPLPKSSRVVVIKNTLYQDLVLLVFLRL